ncbi:MAG: cytochrome P450 [Candidatus Hydrogenedentota bacterium]
MSKKNHRSDWDPDSVEVQMDQRNAYDEMRERCPIAYSETRGWSVFRHADVMRILHAPDVFSNVVSEHVAVPNGMDAPEHTKYRRIVERYFTDEYMIKFEPRCRAVVVELLKIALDKRELDWIADMAEPLAVNCQCAFLGWSSKVRGQLLRWVDRSREANCSKNRDAITSVANEFQGFIDAQIEVCAQAEVSGSEDIVADLVQQEVDGRPLNNREIGSILRNWTVGEIGTIAASVGIIAHYLAAYPMVQEQCRHHPTDLTVVADEILRIDGPLISNRRVTTCPVTMGIHEIGANERISINWIAANRDGRSVDQPESFRLDRDPKQNLLYGSGIHECPGAPLARLELRIFLEELLARTKQIELIESKPGIRATAPASGFKFLPLRVK